MLSGTAVYVRRTPPHCDSGIIGIEEDPNIALIIPASHYYWVGGTPKVYESSGEELLQDLQEGRFQGFRILGPPMAEFLI